MKKVGVSLLLPAFLIFFLATCGGGGGGGGSTSTPDADPIVTSVVATSVDENNATLNASVNPNGLPTQAWFEYGTNPGLQTYSSSQKQDVGNGINTLTVITNLSSLAPGTTYYFRVCAENSAGASEGQIMSFTTASPGSPPAVTTIAATSIGATGGTLNGSVIPNGIATTAWFEWGTNPALATFSSTSTQSVGSGTTSQTVNAALTGLSTGTMYYYRVASSNSSGTTKGNILSCVPGAAPAVTTLAATTIGATGATLNGSVSPNGLTTTAWFEYSVNSSLTPYADTAPQSLPSVTGTFSINAPITGLNPTTTYYYRVVAQNSAGTQSGLDRPPMIGPPVS